MKRNIFLGILSLCVFAAAAVYITYPLIFHMTNYSTSEFVIAWIMNWNIHAITHFIWPLWDANIFYPYHNTLAYSDLFFTSSIIALPFFILFHEPMLSSNITLISSFLFLGFFTYLLMMYITKNFFASILSGLLIIFSPVTLDKRYHLQILAVEWIPLALLFFLHFIQKQQYRFLFLSLLCFVVQAYNSFMAGYFLLFSYAGIVISYLLIKKEVISPLLSKKTFFTFIFSFLLIVPIAIPYFQVSNEFHFVRDIRETIHLALQPEDLLVADETSRLKFVLTFFDSSHYPAIAEVKPGFLGGVFTVLTLLSCVYVIKRKKKNPVIISFLLAGLFGLLLSLGPALHIGRHTIHQPFLIPLPYALAYYLLPGFQGIRDSSRFEMLFVLSMAVVVGIALHELLQRRDIFWKTGIYILLIAGIVGEFQGPFSYIHAPIFESFPPVYTWIAKNTPPHAVIIEMPIYNWDNNPFGDNREVLREYFSTLHFRKLISGGSGFSPPPWQKFATQEFRDFPSVESIGRIGNYGAQYIIVHTDEFDTLHNNGQKAGNHIVYPSRYIISVLSQNKRIRFIIQEGNAYVYQFK